MPNPDYLLIPGQFVTVVVSETKRTRSATVPLGAVQQDREGKYVMLVGPDKTAVKRRITVSVQMNGSWIVESGLEVGESVIVEGLQNIAEGSVVEIDADAASGADADQPAASK